MPHSNGFNFQGLMPEIAKPPIPQIPNPLHGYVTNDNGLGGASFGQTLASMLNKANGLMGDPERMTIDMVSNPNSQYDVHDVMIAMGKSEVAFKLITAMAQKGINTFDKLTNMQI